MVVLLGEQHHRLLMGSLPRALLLRRPSLALLAPMAALPLHAGRAFPQTMRPTRNAELRRLLDETARPRPDRWHMGVPRRMES